MQALAIKYRPKTFEDLTEQESIKTILSYQIDSKTIKHGYLFVGAAGTGKTTSARIFANMINAGKGIPIELDAASNNSVDAIRDICEQARTKSLDSEYKIFILDEVHCLSNQAWQAMLKTLEEPPKKSIFILCTTNPEKIPATILSRVQRYNFQRISSYGIKKRLNYILEQEFGNTDFYVEDSAVDYIASLAQGGMRDAITLMDKCLSYAKDLTMDNVVNALGVANYDDMFELLDIVLRKDVNKMFLFFDNIYKQGVDLKLFVSTFFEFILDLLKYRLANNFDCIKIPGNYEDTINSYGEYDFESMYSILSVVLDIVNCIKWEKDSKPLIQAKLALYLVEN